MLRKLIKVGTSAAVIIPKEILNERRVKIGDTIEIEIRKKGKGGKTIDPEIFEWTEKFRKRYKPLLNKLKSS